MPLREASSCEDSLCTKELRPLVNSKEGKEDENEQERRVVRAKETATTQKVWGQESMEVKKWP